jgi:hypothetical protein
MTEELMIGGSTFDPVPLFTPHGFCLAWEPALLWLTVLGDFGTAIAYFGIPLVLLTSRRVVLTGWLGIMFAGFIFLCGTGHLLQVLAIWRPVYWWIASESVLTGFVSLATLYYLPVAVSAIQRSPSDAAPRPPAD